MDKHEKANYFIKKIFSVFSPFLSTPHPLQAHTFDSTPTALEFALFSCSNSPAEHLLRPLSRFMKQTTSPELCKKCAQCCKNFPFVEVSPQEINDLELESALHADLFTHAKGAVVDGYFLQFKKNGDCFFLHEKNGVFFCAVYTARPGICQKYPSLPVEKATCRHHMQKKIR